MSRCILGALLAIVLALSARGRGHTQSASEPDSGGVVCQPGVNTSTGACLPLGPSTYVAELARLGLAIPADPLPSIRPAPGLAELPYRYFHVISDQPVAVGGAPGLAGGEALYPGFVYIGYSDRVDTGHGIYYLAQSGGWVPGRGERVGEIPSFHGLEFKSTPRSAFGWSFEDIPVRSGPGFGFPETGRRIRPFSPVSVYGTEEVDAGTWNRVGLDERVEARKIAQVNVSTSTPEGAGDTQRWIDVNIAEQTMAVYDQHRLVFATMIASGVEPFWTRPGTFQIYNKVESETMRNNDPSDFYYLEDVPWTMYFDDPRALHGAYWRTRFGYPQSHGCVNLSVSDAHWLFNWAQAGDWVYVHDPTGKTPTDSALYTGGAY